MVRVLEVMGRSTGGVGRHVAALVSGLDDGDIEVEVAAPSGTTIPMPKPITPVEIPKRPGPSAVGAVRQLRSSIESGRFDVVHAHGLRASLIALRAARAVPVISTLHNLIQPETSGRIGNIVYRRGEAEVVRGARRVFAVSEEMVAELRLRVPDAGSKVELLKIGLPAPPATRSTADVRAELSADDRPIVITLARLVRQKALDVLLEAVARLDRALLVVVGDGALLQELKDQAQALGISDRVRFLGWKEDVGDYLHAADVFALSSSWEARALAVQEAILAGIPVVATDVGGLPELITDRRSGRLVPPGDAIALADAIEEVLAAPEVAADYASEARSALAASYSDEAMLELVRRAYVEVAGA